MPSVNLSEKYSGKIAERFSHNSLLKGRLSTAYDFVGAKTVKIYSISTVPMNDYNTGVSANRYGTPVDVGDEIQELTMRKKRSFSAVLDKTIGVDQAINKAAVFLRTQIDERVTPEQDAYALEQLATCAGKIVAGTGALTGNGAIKRANAARAWFANNAVPVGGRTWYVSSAFYNALMESDYFQAIEKVGERALVNGQVGRLMGAPVVEVPDTLMPKGVNFILLHKESAILPVKLEDAVVNNEPQGISGTLVEGVYYYDAFVIGARAAGIYVDVDGAAATVCKDPEVDTSGNITLEEGCTAKYTTDGSDPRYSKSAKTLSATGEAAGAKEGDTIKVVQYKDGSYPSGVAAAVKAGE